MGKIRNFVKAYRASKKQHLTIYVLLRVLVIICMVDQILSGDLNNAFLCLLSLVLFSLPLFLRNKFKITLPNLLESLIYLFIFATEILGEIYNFYGNIPHWDTLLHTINGFLCAGIGFALVDLLNDNSTLIDLSPIYISLVAFCFSMSVGVIWEFYEYGADKLLQTDMQKDTVITSISSLALAKSGKKEDVKLKNIHKSILYDASGEEIIIISGGYLDIGINDTMKDLLVNFIGAVTFSFFGYFYTKNKERYKFTKNFIPLKSIS